MSQFYGSHLQALHHMGATLEHLLPVSLSVPYKGRKQLRGKKKRVGKKDYEERSSVRFLLWKGRGEISKSLLVKEKKQNINKQV